MPLSDFWDTYDNVKVRLHFHRPKNTGRLDLFIKGEQFSFPIGGKEARFIMERHGPKELKFIIEQSEKTRSK